MNSTPPQTAAPAAKLSGQPSRGRVADYDRLVDGLAYTHDGIFSRASMPHLQPRITALLRDLNI